MIRLIFILFLASATSVSALITDDIPHQYRCEPTNAVISAEVTGDKERKFRKVGGEVAFVTFMESKGETFLIYSWKENDRIFVLPKVYTSSDGFKHKFISMFKDMSYIWEITTTSDLKQALDFKIREVSEGILPVIGGFYGVNTYNCTVRN